MSQNWAVVKKGGKRILRYPNGDLVIAKTKKEILFSPIGNTPINELDDSGDEYELKRIKTAN